uniref:TxLP7 n=1 Tax=Lychas mucronatus TaxID=172552 RepID=A0A0U1S4E8_LYCMC|nr:TxLP7 [Lychas mucronatus]
MKPILIVFLIVTVFGNVLGYIREFDSSKIPKKFCLPIEFTCQTHKDRCCKGTMCICPISPPCTCRLIGNLQILRNNSTSYNFNFYFKQLFRHF